jgi:hypothetical protein
MKKRFLIILLSLGLTGLACQVSGLPFISTPTPMPTNTLRPTVTPIPTLAPTETLVPTATLPPSNFQTYMPECLKSHFKSPANYAGWQPLFCDDFAHADAWGLPDYSYSAGTIQKKVLSSAGQLSWIVTAATSNTFMDFIPIGPDKLSSFDLSVRELKVDGPNSWFGIIFNYQPDPMSYYAFAVDYGGQKYSTWIYQNNQWTAINAWAPSTAIKPASGPDAWNTVSVRGEGTNYTCSVNGKVVQKFTDDRLPAGWTGISVMADPNTTTTFLFDDIVLLGKP